MVFFLDRCLGRTVVAEALRAKGETVEIMDDHYEREVEDAVWIAEVGAKGWVILTKDRAIRTNTLELAALLKSGTHSFVLTSANQTGKQMAETFVVSLPGVKKLVSKFPPPFVRVISMTGAVRVHFTHEQLLAAIARGGSV